MIMTNTKQCRTRIYGEKWSGVYTCGRCFEKDGTINQGRIPIRTEKKCFGYVRKGMRKMNAMIVEKKEPEKTAEPVVENTVESVEKSDDKPKKHSWTDGDTETLIHFYNKGAEIKALAEMFETTETAVRIKLQKLKRSDRWSGYFTDSGTASKTEILPEPETLVSEKRKVYKASGIGFIDVAGGMIALDGTALTLNIGDFLEKSGMTNFYGKVEVKITPIQPTGITVSVEEE